MPKKSKKELVIIIAWHEESDTKKTACFYENRRTLEFHNPGIEIVTVKSDITDKKTAWLSSDITIFKWFNANQQNLQVERFLLLEWDCWCDMNLKEYFSLVWDCDVVGPSVKYYERDKWDWFNSIDKLPHRARIFATGIVPFCGILLSSKAMTAINNEILKDEFQSLNSELRLPTIATMLGFDPVPNPVCSRIITWKHVPPFDAKYHGIHHPRKILPSDEVVELVEVLLKMNISGIPHILHQTWKNDDLPDNIKALSKTWKECHPDWQYILWTDEMNRDFIRLYYPEFLVQYDAYENNIQRVDAVRYFILHKVGGLFVDLDFECMENVESLLLDAECVFALEPLEHCVQFGKEKIICNAFMASKPNSNFFNTICNTLDTVAWKEVRYINRILETTGPFALTAIYDDYAQKDEVKILPSSTVYPLTVEETRRLTAGQIDANVEQKINDAFALHFFWGTWYNKL